MTSSARARPPRAGTSALPWRPDVHSEHRVLLVDETRHGHALLERLAGAAGMAVHHARSVADAVRHALKFSYDVILVDDRSSGAGLLHQLLAKQSTAAVLISGEASHIPEDLQLEGNLLGSLRKPWEEEELDLALRRALALSRARRSQHPGAAAVLSTLNRVLLVAKSADARRVSRLLKGRLPPGALVCAGSLAEALALCGEQSFDVVVTDTWLGDACGLDAVVKIRRAAPQAATVALTSTDDGAFSDQVLQAGAQDVLLKAKLDADSLVRSVEHALSRQRAQAHLEYGALHDELTGLAKRTLLYQRTAHALARSRRMGNTFALMYIDLDHFKCINDQHGHDAGDAVLVAVSQRLRCAVREYDTVARLGGDEFAILLDSLDGPAEAEIVAQRVLDSLTAPVRVNGQELDVTASMGISVFPEGGDAAEELLKSADRAMYCAKRAGRNTYSLNPMRAESRPPVSGVTSALPRARSS